MRRTKWNSAGLYSVLLICIVQSASAHFAALLYPAALLCICIVLRVAPNGAALVYIV